jgi:hypothetical protein
VVHKILGSFFDRFVQFFGKKMREIRQFNGLIGLFIALLVVELLL